jgi:uncharacterized protein YkuJ
MANRAYLYSARKDFKKIRDLSEGKSPISLVYKILLGVDTELCNSELWNYEHPIAIRSNMEKGLERMYEFYEYLETQPNINRTAIVTYKKEARDFFHKHGDRVMEYFFLEAGEIFDMTADVEPIEKQNKALFNEITSIAADIVDILEKRPARLFNYKTSPWLLELQKDAIALSCYWTHITFYSFNKSGKRTQIRKVKGPE